VISESVQGLSLRSITRENTENASPGLDLQKVQEGIELVYQEALIENQAMEVKF